jgi:hypothetical protein
MFSQPRVRGLVGFEFGQIARVKTLGTEEDAGRGESECFHHGSGNRQGWDQARRVLESSASEGI